LALFLPLPVPDAAYGGNPFVERSNIHRTDADLARTMIVSQSGGNANWKSREVKKLAAPLIVHCVNSPVTKCSMKLAAHSMRSCWLLLRSWPVRLGGWIALQ
jgi:hypothetical protein